MPKVGSYLDFLNYLGRDKHRCLIENAFLHISKLDVVRQATAVPAWGSLLAQGERRIDTHARTGGTRVRVGITHS